VVVHDRYTNLHVTVVGPMSAVARALRESL
jgi:hypothetical protein